jgi:hypothetical protein
LPDAVCCPAEIEPGLPGLVKLRKKIPLPRLSELPRLKWLDASGSWFWLSQVSLIMPVATVFAFARKLL